MRGRRDQLEVERYRGWVSVSVRPRPERDLLKLPAAALLVLVGMALARWRPGRGARG
jgi:hypothetical protein